MGGRGERRETQRDQRVTLGRIRVTTLNESVLEIHKPLQGVPENLSLSQIHPPEWPPQVGGTRMPHLGGHLIYHKHYKCAHCHKYPKDGSRDSCKKKIHTLQQFSHRWK